MDTSRSNRAVAQLPLLWFERGPWVLEVSGYLTLLNSFRRAGKWIRSHGMLGQGTPLTTRSRNGSSGKKSLDALPLARRAQRESRYREGRLDACSRRVKRPSKEVPVCAIQH